jgi:hypothetical protein
MPGGLLKRKWKPHSIDEVVAVLLVSFSAPELNQCEEQPEVTPLFSESDVFGL